MKFIRTTFSAKNKYLIIIAVLLFAMNNGFGHTINYELENAPGSHVFWYYFKLGILHIVPYGLDHILFVVGLCLLNNKIKSMLWQATAFTVAHSITLVLSMKNIVVAPPAIIEPIIALSILFIAIENLITSELKPWRIILVFCFGLVHGLGFASALNEVGLPRDNFITSLFAFNVGVEAGQVLIISAIFLLLIIPFSKKWWFKRRVVYPLSVLIGLIALYWTIERFIRI
ncbi:MAG: HupE/UreJ family protein [Ferruginibacter sp.]